MSCPNYMGAPVKDVPSEKVVVTDRLAASTGGVVYVKGPRTLAATGPGDYGLFLTNSGGTGEPFFSIGNQAGNITSGKTFVIDHPKKAETHYLVYACLEGPEAGVYYRGKARIMKGELNTVVELPAYAHALADRFTIQVTPIDTFVMITTSRVHVNTNTFVVSIPAVLRHDLEFFWLVMGQREPLEAEISKDRATVMGQGPYRWLIKKDL